jgi:endo-1,4-beta-xylanase
VGVGVLGGFAALALALAAASPSASASAGGLGAVGVPGLGATQPRVPARVPPKPIPARRTIELGAAVWYACTDDAYTGPWGLACPYRPPGPSLTTTYRRTWSTHFDRLTPENELKAVWTERTEGHFDFRVADKVVGLARARSAHVRGHALVYAQADPGWVRHPLVPRSRAALLAVMQRHIRTEMGHFQSVAPGTIDEWDVVNEPFAGNGRRDQNVYQRTIGDDWIEQAFRTAHDQDPAAVLMLNEFNADTPGPRHDAVLALARDFVQRGVPIDGIGLQMHVGAFGAYPTLDQIKRVMADFAALKLRVEVTELDVLRPVFESVPGARQRATYNDVAQACRESPNCTGVTIWGVADAYGWITLAQHGTLFDESQQDVNGLFAAKRVPGAATSTYDDVRCRLNHPWPTAADPGADPCDPRSPSATTPAGAVAHRPSGARPHRHNRGRTAGRHRRRRGRHPT